MSEIIDCHIVVTRKPHKCWGCAREFPAGSKLQRITTAECGEIMSAHWCATCQAFWDKHYRHEIDGIAQGEFNGEELWETFRAERESNFHPTKEPKNEK